MAARGDHAAMKTWTLTITGGRGVSEHTIIGAAENTERAREQLFTAATAMIRRADIDERPPTRCSSATSWPRSSTPVTTSSACPTTPPPPS